MGRQRNRFVSKGSTIDKAVSRGFRRRLALTTILATAPFLGYGRVAYAACNTSGAPTVVCDGTIGGFSFTDDNLHVSTDGNPPFVVTASGVAIDGNGHIQFIDNHPSSITNLVAGEPGLGVRSNGDDGTIPGAVTIVTDADISGAGDGIGAFNAGSGDIDLTANGEVTGNGGNGIDAYNSITSGGIKVTTGAQSVISGADTGIRGYNRGDGDLVIEANGKAYGTLDDGISASSAGRDLMVTTGAESVISGGYNGITAENAGIGDLVIEARGDVTGETGDGINAFNPLDLYGENSGDLRVTTGAGSTVSGGGHGINARSFGDGELEIIANGVVTGESLDGIKAFHFGAGDLRITTGANSQVTGRENGIHAYNYGSGAVDITTAGAVHAGADNDGIKAYNSANGTDLTIATDAGSAVSGGDDGMQVTNYGNGNLEITVEGSVTGENAIGISAINSYGYVYDPGDPYGPPIGKNLGIDLTITTRAASVVTGAGEGILANNFGTGNLKIDVGGGVTGGADGIYAENGGYADDLTITTGAGSAVTGGEDGIDARNYGTGNLKMTVDGAVTGGNYGIYARNQGDGSIDLTVNGQTTGTTLDGIYAWNRTGSENLTITTGAASVVTGFEYGIDARNEGNGNLAITVDGDVTGQTKDGMFIYNDDAGANLTVRTGAGSVVRGSDDGMEVEQEGTGTFEVTVDGEATGQSGFGIYTDNWDGPQTIIRVGATGLAQGGSGGIYAFSDKGQPISITNDGTVRNLSAESDDQAIFTRDGATTIDNNANLIGSVALSAGNDTLNNAGLWNTAGGTSDFGNNSNPGDVVNNTGTLIAADDGTTPEHTFLNNLEFLNNAGLVSLRDGAEGDTLTMMWNFVGQGGRLGVDAFLGPGGTSDQVFVGLDTFGVTYVVVNSTNPIGSAPNFEGIPVVVVDEITTDGQFDVEGGVLNAGFFAWDMRLDTDGHTHELYTSGIGAGAYEFAAGIGGATEMWHQTSGTVLQRQADLRGLLGSLGVTPVADYAEPVEPTPVAKITPGFWFKGVGAYVEQDDEENGYSLDREQTIWGGMAGFDSGTQDIGDALLFGVFAGYLTSDLEFDETNTEWTYEGPTIGAYATYLDHAFYVDATVKVDFLDIDIDPEDLAPAADDADTDATNIGARVDTGYKFGETYFIEPQATLAVVHTEIDDVDIFGGTVEFDDATSVRGRLGVRLGYEETASSGVIYSGDVTASVWEDFSDDNEVTIIDTGIPDFGASDDAGGTIGDVALGLSAIAPDGWSGFIRANYLFAEDYDAITGNAGLRYAF